MARKMRSAFGIYRITAMICFTCIVLSDNAWPQVSAEVTTIRDDRGVWFITGTDETPNFDLFEAMGYAVACDRLWQADLLRRQARGRLAEIFGKDYLESDIFQRSISYTEAELQEGFGILNKDTRDVISGYVEGFNRRIDEVTADSHLMPFEYTTQAENLGKSVPPRRWTESDILATMALIQRSFDPEALGTGQLDNLKLLQHLQAVDPDHAWAMFEDLRWTNDADADTYIDADQTIWRGGKRRSAVNKQLKINARAAARLSAERQRMFAGLDAINARIRMGSYAWVVSGEHTRSGHPILYSGPQMGFSVPSIVVEGSLKGANLEISGMTIPGVPCIIIGRTPHHTWSMQVGHAHTTDYYFHTSPQMLDLTVRLETFHIAGAPKVTLPIYRTQYGPLISPRSLDPATYVYDGSNPIISWRYAHWGYEFKAIEGFLQSARAQSMEAFGAGIDKIAVSQHFCYADRKGNIAYWMSGRNPARYAGEWRLPQGSLPGVEASEWIADEVVPPPKDHNPARGYYGGWNNKAHPDYDNAYNEIGDIYGPFHRAHTIYDYIEARLSKSYGHKLSFEQLRDLALDIAATDSLAIGGNPWPHLAPYFQKAVLGQWWQHGNWQQKIQRLHALWLLKKWDGHFVAGGREKWAAGPDRADAWMLMDAWVHEVLRLTFVDELGGYLSDGDHGVMTAKNWPVGERRVLINVLLHALNRGGDIVNAYDWFKNIGNGISGRRKIIIAALDNALAHLGRRPWGKDQRGWITYEHRLLGKVWQTPFANRSTYAQVVEMGPEGPVRIESMFPLGQSGHIWTSATGEPELDPGFLGMTDIFDTFEHRAFPLFE